MSYFSSHPMYDTDGRLLDNIYKNTYYKLDDEIWNEINWFNDNIKILEIGYGGGSFASFCDKKWFKNYVWVDLDDCFAGQLKEKFPNYEFLQWDINAFLDNGYKYDIIFMSHVFEHLDRNQADMAIKNIYKSLNKWWMWINYMPNADSFKATTARYNDITHKTIYNANSFEQIVLMDEVKYSELKNKNTIAAVSLPFRWIFKVINPIFVFFTKIYFLWMWYTFPKIYSSELLTIMKK